VIAANGRTSKRFGPKSQRYGSGKGVYGYKCQVMPD
jgi:hypothetical protein